MQFWSIATVMVVATTAVLIIPLFWRARKQAAADSDSPNATSKRPWFAFAIGAVVPLTALALYVWAGRADLATVTSAPPPVAAEVSDHARNALRGSDQNGGDLDAAVTRLRARLAANPADAAGWRLLAQSYEFQGRASEAAQANKMAEQAEAGTAVAPAVAAPISPIRADDAANKLAQSAEDFRRRRDFPQAVKAFAALAKRGAMSADLWADYADALGGARGTLDDDAADCIAQALKLEPDHAKALWLLASLQTQREDFRAALSTWQHLARVLPPDSPDSRIIAANLAEARSKLGAGVADAPAPDQKAIALRGSVRLNPRWTERVSSDAVLFVFARAADERGPPLAVWRTTAGPFPMNFLLDDRNAMMPGRKLSDFSRVILEARISRTGNALAQPGDLRAVSSVLDPRTAPSQQLTIDEEVVTQKPAGG